MSDKPMISEEAVNAVLKKGVVVADSHIHLCDDWVVSTIERMRDYDSKPKYSPLVEMAWKKLAATRDGDYIRGGQIVTSKDWIAKALEGVVEVPEEATKEHLAVFFYAWQKLHAKVQDGIQAIFDHLRKEAK